MGKKIDIREENYNGKRIRVARWYHNYAYRFLLRSADHMGEYKNWKRCQVIYFERKYIELHSEFLKEGLDPSGFSEEHTSVIAKVFKLDKESLINEYHRER